MVDGTILPILEYTDDVADLDPEWLRGFFDGWPNPPSPTVHLELLKQSYSSVVAIDRPGHQVAGFVTAISDGVLSAYLPLLEVHSVYRGRGVGRDLVRRVLATLQGLYMVDLVCDAELERFYSPLGFVPGHAMLMRDYEAQSGRRRATG